MEEVFRSTDYQLLEGALDEEDEEIVNTIVVETAGK
jgi:hypothetical protein